MSNQVSIQDFNNLLLEKYAPRNNANTSLAPIPSISSEDKEETKKDSLEDLYYGLSKINYKSLSVFGVKEFECSVSFESHNVCIMDDSGDTGIMMEIFAHEDGETYYLYINKNEIRLTYKEIVKLLAEMDNSPQTRKVMTELYK